MIFIELIKQISRLPSPSVSVLGSPWWWLHHHRWRCDRLGTDKRRNGVLVQPSDGLEDFMELLRPQAEAEALSAKWRYSCISLKASKDRLQKGVKLIQDKGMKVVVDSEYEFDDVEKAFEKLRTRRARGHCKL
ncbi:BZ3500_MvSof-1268-A1-R1_Chr1-3g02250 [Microbotryum saponariae]|uniref:BZ3500_MvSof-1268-A1-R1_Chr1-3g02250 protein n=1 Tax=Microbotryum saponariae TaxID=289078 RepID=A0A2X0MNA0_9BASI|nr:BZ3500_MvSof-1268-A1-R1_Chr1-3g02250 [Microbotryum saponariae]SCZ95780.1 BZ3501_MvSof-1269-A2-R1_Chr1-3g01853 [Microbotryum saponariae]